MERDTMTYRSKFLQNDTYNANSIHNRNVISEFSTMALPDPCRNAFEHFMSKFELPAMIDNTSVNYVRYNGDYYISCETNFMNKMDIETLEKTEKVGWSKFIAVNGATADPHYDLDGTAYNMGNSYGPHDSCYNVIRVPPEMVDLGDTTHGAHVICSSPSAKRVYNSVARSFPRRFVLPLYVNLNAPEGENLRPLSYSSASAVKQPDGKIWCSYENLHPENLEEEGGIEFPQINYGQLSGKKYHFFYGCGFRHLVGDSLIKVDVVNKTLKVWREDGFYPLEHVFVPVPGTNEEDGGVILSVVITPNQNKSNFLLVLDAKNFEELGQPEVPVQMPYRFHGTFVNI